MLLKAMEESLFLKAARYMKLETVLRLIEQGECLNQQNLTGETALIIVCKNMFVHKDCSETSKIFTKLIDKGSDPNIQDTFGQTALMHAVMSLSTFINLELWSADRYVFEKLIFSGADISLKDTFGRNALDLARDNSAITKMLYEIMAENAFLDAVKDLRLETVFRLLQQGECLDQQNSSGETALIILAKDSTVHTSGSAARKIFTELINYGADPNIGDALGKTALMYAAESLSHVPDSETRPTDLYAVEMLIMNGADVTVKDKLGQSALDVSGDNNRSQCLDILLDAYNKDDNNRSQCLDILLDAYNKDDNNRSQCLDILLDAYNKVDKMGSFFTSIKMGRFDFCLRHIISCPDLNATDEEGNNLLMLVLKYFNIHKQREPCVFFKLCEKMILYGADLNVQNNKGETALMLLFITNCPFDDTWHLGLFVNDGAKLDIKDNNGNTALIHAMNAASEKSVIWLLEHGADPHIGSKNSQVLIKFIADSGTSITCTYINRIVRAEQFQLVRLLVVNGVIDVNSATLEHAMDFAEVMYNSPDAFMTLSPFMFALVKKRLGIAKFLLANCYLTPEDLRYRPGHALEAFLPAESTVLLRDLFSQPWPLGKLAFVVVSNAVGSYPERISRIESLEIPRMLKSMLNFRDLAGSLCIDEWSNIAVHSRDYDTINAGRPLLFYWPCGQSSLLVKKKKVKKL